MARLAQTGTQRLKVKSAITPILWLCAFATPCFLAAAKLIPEYTLVLIIIAVSPVGVACLSYVYFAFEIAEISYTYSNK